MSQALEFYRSPVRYLAARGITATGVGGRLTGAVAGSVSPIRLVDRPSAQRSGPDWVRLRPLLSGICGSDLALLSGRSSPYLGPMASLPFVPGHEIVAESLEDAPGLPMGSRVVVDPVLSCAARSTPPCHQCRTGRPNRCEHVTTGALKAGLQTGCCTDTGGGWSRSVLAHVSQLHAVPDTLDDRSAVLVEPLACAVHSVRRVSIPPGASVLVVGAGTVGLLTILALREFTAAGPVYVVAKHPHQQAKAEALGATETFGVRRTARALRMVTGGSLEHPDIGAEFLLGGVDVAFDCTGGANGLDTALRTVRAGGTVVMSGMPSGAVDLTPVWFRELNLIGSYASNGGGGGGTPSTAPDFAEAVRLAGQAAPLAGYVDSVYPLSRWREAIGHALAAGRLGTVKVAFDPNLS
ncbi:zinc-binding dehydrogenase [Streptomyces sp. NPDC005374]|uniref:zinc-dependent alcohol dehydrogenase n=1 Tax=Streptomyces sp. NPDC005374 TaxID=3364713 RepID=UPI00368FBBAF